MENINTAIVFFSKDGSTKLAAKLLYEKSGGVIIELKEKRRGGVIKALFKMGSMLLDEPWNEIKSADKVYLMLPIWAGNGVPAMNTFIKNADFKGKKVSVITVQADNEFKGSDKVHNYISSIIKSRGGVFVASYALLGAGIKKCAGESDMREQIGKVKLIQD